MVRHFAPGGDFLPSAPSRDPGWSLREPCDGKGRVYSPHASAGLVLAATRHYRSELDARMPPTERRVYRTSSTRRKLGYAGVAVVAVLLAGLIYELVALPRVAAVSPSQGGYVNETSPSIVLEVHGLDGLEGIRVTLDGADVTGAASWDGERMIIAGIDLEDGVHAVRLSADSSNLLRRRLDEQLSFTVDTRAPEVTLDPACADGTLTTDPPELTGSTEPGARVEVAGGTRSAVAYADAAGRFTLHPDLLPGPATLEIVASDAAGNSTATTLPAYADATPPTLVLDEVKATVRRATFSLDAAASDTGLPPELAAMLDGKPFSVAGDADAARLRFKKLAQGKHTLVVTATDKGGNTVKEHRAFVVDSTERLGVAALWPGARGRDVRDLQTLLDARGLYEGEVTGTLDAATTAAVEAFQERYGLPVDGRVEGETMTSLGGRIVVDLSDLTLRFFRSGKKVKTYRVAAGQAAYPTPTGTYAVIRMIMDPTWYPPDSDWAKDAKPIPPGIENPLGTRWIGTSAPGVGIHGTPDDASIGTHASHGCIRMHIPEVEELYERVALGMTVIIKP
jgi:peptidoglycan hydrolase-like protein with peptidoglycan-binding domain